MFSTTAPARGLMARALMAPRSNAAARRTQADGNLGQLRIRMSQPLATPYRLTGLPLSSLGSPLLLHRRLRDRRCLDVHIHQLTDAHRHRRRIEAIDDLQNAG